MRGRYLLHSHTYISEAHFFFQQMLCLGECPKFLQQKTKKLFVFRLRDNKWELLKKKKRNPPICAKSDKLTPVISLLYLTELSVVTLHCGLCRLQDDISGSAASIFKKKNLTLRYESDNVAMLKRWNTLFDGWYMVSTWFLFGFSCKTSRFVFPTERQQVFDWTGYILIAHIAFCGLGSFFVRFWRKKMWGNCNQHVLIKR